MKHSSTNMTLRSEEIRREFQDKNEQLEIAQGQVKQLTSEMDNLRGRYTECQYWEKEAADKVAARKKDSKQVITENNSNA